MKKLPILLLLLSLSAFCQEVDSELLYDNHIKAAGNFNSTFQLYTVVSIDKGNSDTPLEICITGSTLMYALQDEWNLDFEDYDGLMQKVKENKERVFKIKSQSALDRIERIKYSLEDLSEFRNKVKFDSIVQNLRNTDKWRYFGSNEKEQAMMAHLLFKEGIPTGINECFGGEELQIVYEF